MKTARPLTKTKEIKAARLLIRRIAKAIRWKEPVLDPAETPCMVAILTSQLGFETGLMVAFDGPSLVFPITQAGGAITINGEFIRKTHNGYIEITSAIKEFITILGEEPMVAHSLDLKSSVVWRFVERWKELDPSLEPKSSFELFRLFGQSESAKAILQDVRLQQAPYIYKEYTRHQQLHDFLESRPDYIRKIDANIGDGVLWVPRR